MVPNAIDPISFEKWRDGKKNISKQKVLANIYWEKVNWTWKLSGSSFTISNCHATLLATISIWYAELPCCFLKVFSDIFFPIFYIQIHKKSDLGDFDLKTLYNYFIMPNPNCL